MSKAMEKEPVERPGPCVICGAWHSAIYGVQECRDAVAQLCMEWQGRAQRAEAALAVVRGTTTSLHRRVQKVEGKAQREVNRARARATDFQKRNLQLVGDVTELFNRLQMEQNAHAVTGVQLSEATEREEVLHRHLQHLLARIHRDGGHYTAKHGIEKSVADADGLCAYRVAALESLEATEKEVRSHLFGLIADIYENGEQYAAQHGLGNAVEYAGRVCANLRSALRSAQAQQAKDSETIKGLEVEVDALRKYAGSQLLMSDFQTADDMRAELDRVREKNDGLLLLLKSAIGGMDWRNCDSGDFNAGVEAVAVWVENFVGVVDVETGDMVHLTYATPTVLAEWIRELKRVEGGDGEQAQAEAGQPA